MRLWLVVVLVVLAGCGEESVRLSLTHTAEAPAPGEPVPVEGSVQFVELRRAGDDPVVVRLRARTETVSVPAGDYQVLSYSRPCTGGCEQLGEPAGRCAAALTFRRDRSLVVQTAPGEICFLQRS